MEKRHPVASSWVGDGPGSAFSFAESGVKAASPTPKIAPVLVLIALILFGVGVIAVAGTVLLLRSAPAIKARQARNSDSELAESEVYKKLYGKRSLTVSAPMPVEAPPKADPGHPGSQPSADPRPRTHRRSRARDSHP
jgi:hypothetical protein